MTKMDDIRLITEVEKYRELYDPQHMFYKDNMKKDNCWEAVATAIGSTMEECKRRWKQLRDAFVKNKNKSVPSGSMGGTSKDWKYSNLMSFLIPHMQPRSSKSTLRPMNVSLETSEEHSSDAGPSGVLSRPVTPSTPTPRSASSSPLPTEGGQASFQLCNPPAHPRVQALSATAPTETPQTQRKRSKRSSLEGPTEQQLLQFLTADQVPVPPHVPKDNEEMYFFALSLVPMLNRLHRSSQTAAKLHILKYLADLENSEMTHASSTPTTSQWQQAPQLQSHEYQSSYPGSSAYFHPIRAPPSSTYQQQIEHTMSPSQQGQRCIPTSTPAQQRSVKRSASMMEEIEDLSSPTAFHHFE